MKKSIKRTLSLLLALTMVLSLGLPAYAVGAPAEEAVVIADEEPVELPEQEPVEEPVEKPSTLPIGAGKIPGIVEEEESISEDLIVDIVDEETVVEEEVAPAKVFAYSESATGFTVEVSAPAGALPLGTEMFVDRLVDLSAVQAAVDNAEDLNGSVQLAADISFWLEGKEIEPAEGAKLVVRMSAPEIEAIAAPVIVHIPDGENAVPEIVEQLSAGDVMMADTVSFETGSFSVYCIISEEPPAQETYRRTYKFTTDGTEPFEFYNKAGKLVSEQIVKNGDKLEEVTLPYSASHTFQNWVVSASDDDAVAVDTPVNLPMDINDIGEKDTTVTLKPAYGNVYYVTFHAGLASASPDIIQTKKIVVEGEKFVIGDVQAPAPDDSHIFYGWTPDGDGSAAHATPIYNDEHQLVADTEYPETISADLDLYPYFVEAYWLRFISGETGSRASYVPAQFVLANEKVTELPVPTRTGYTFDGWYTGSLSDDGTITYADQITDGEGKVINPSSGLSISEETTLYGKWEPSENSSYKVVIWRQKVGDDKDAANDEKTYDYVDSYIENGKTGDPANPKTADTTHSGGDYTGFHFDRTVKTSDTIEPDGSTVVNVYYDRDLQTVIFHYQDGHQPADAEGDFEYIAVTDQRYINAYVQNGTQLYGLKEDGTYAPVTPTAHTTTRVYYTYTSWWDEYEYNGTFYTRSGRWPNYTYNATQYNGNNLPPAGDNTTYYTDEATGRESLTRRTETTTTYTWAWEDGSEYTGTLYRKNATGGDTPYTVTWTGLYGQSFAQNGYTWPADYQWNEQANGGGTYQTFLTDFVQSSNPYHLYDQGEAGTSVIYHYKQGLDGKYAETEGVLRFTAHGSGGSFNFSKKFEGFSVKSYNTGNNGFNEDGGSNTNMNDHPSTYPLHVYHERNKWNISYQSTRNEQSTQMEVVATRTGIYYEAPLSSYNLTPEQAGLAAREHYTFAGWYADATLTKPFNFSGTMPNANVTVYAKWDPVWYMVKVDPDGGVITPDIGSTYFWESYHDSEKVGRYEIQRNYIEDPNGEYTYVYLSGDNDPEGEIKVRTATYVKGDPASIEGSDGKKYKVIDPANDPTYSLVGWYIVDPTTGETTDTPYDFDAEIEGPVWIRAVWNLGGDYGLQYNPTSTMTVDEETVTVSGTFTQADPDARYADGAEIVVDAPPTNITPAAVFDGWEIVEPDEGSTPGAVLDDNDGKYYQPGETLTLDAAAWSRHRTVYLRAHYTPIDTSSDPVSVTYLKFDPNFPADSAESGRVGEATPVMYYPLNSAIDLGNDEDVPKNYAAYGYELIGWSQDKNADPVVHANWGVLGKMVFGLKDVVGVDGITPTEKATFVDDNGNEKEVDCNVLYAIWAPQYFYVYQSSNNQVTRVPLAAYADSTYDLTQHVVKENYLYGGYYRDYAGKTEGFAIANLTFDETTNVATDTGATPYDGKSVTWNLDDAYKPGDEDFTGAGNAIKPVANAVYYIKEVPGANYLKHMMKFTYLMKSKMIGTSWLITNADDSNYGDIGFEILDAGTNLGNNAGVKTDKMTIMAVSTGNKSDYKVSSEIEGDKLKPMFDNGKLMSYKLVYNNPEAKTDHDHESDPLPVDKNVDILAAGSIVRNYWVTPDGLKVTSTMVRTYNQVTLANGPKPTTVADELGSQIMAPDKTVG